MTPGPALPETKGCRQNNLVLITSALIWQNARKDAPFLAYRVATARHCLKSRNAFSTKKLSQNNYPALLSLYGSTTPPPSFSPQRESRALYLNRLGPVHTNSYMMLQSENGNYRSSVPTHCSDPSRSAWQRQPVEPASAQRNPLCRRARLQMAGIAASIWQLAHRLHPDEPVVQERGARPSLRISATRADSAY